jgi:hypothetical protein
MEVGANQYGAAAVASDARLADWRKWRRVGVGMQDSLVQAKRVQQPKNTIGRERACKMKRIVDFRGMC